MIGKSLRSYRIESKLGAGGMGVVYKAVDSRLGRTAAIKILSTAALNADRERRFVQEAKAASSLNHPNIVTIYDIDTQEVDGKPIQYIAMEYVAGDTLDHLIGRKGLRIRDVLKYAVQIADALAAAHAAGIVHRDLKPSNVIVTPQGVVKILDFGLAKLSEPAGADAYAETLHGEGSPLTEEGTILGTVAYMSPEQADGKKVDTRSDVFSFGSVLYEMATGQRAFAGGSKLSSLSAVLYKDPQPASQAVADVPPELDRIISRCLKKDPERRWQTMADVKVALEELREEMDFSNFALAGPTSVPRKASRIRLWTGAGLLAGILLGLGLRISYERRYSPPPEPPSYRRLTFRRGDVTSAKFAPGDTVVYSAEWDGAPSTLFSAQPGNREAQPLALPSARVLAISSSGEMAILLGGEDVGTLARVPFGGGAPREVLEGVSGADWGPDGESLAVVRALGGKFRLEYPIGTVLYETEKRPPMMPRVSTDGKLVAFFDFDVEVGDYALCVIGPNHPRQVLSRGWRSIGALNWSPDNREVWFSGGQPGGDPALYAVTLSGAQRLVSQTGGMIVMQDVARDGRVLLTTVNSRLGIHYLPPNGGAQRDLAWLDSSLMYDLSNDAQSIVFVELSSGQGRNSAIYLRKTDGSPAVQLGSGNRPSLSPDGKWVACIHHEAGTSSLMLLPTGPGESRFPKIEGMHFDGVEWFPDNKHILFTGNETGHETRTWMYDLETNQSTPLTPEGTRGTRVSPDGKWFITVDAHKLLLSPVSGGDSKTIADLQGESVVRWSGDGRYLFLQQREPASIKISRLDMTTRRKEPWLIVKVPEPGAQFLGPLALSADGKACATTFQRDLANLFLVRGLK
jgi:serine/threonine protein kinase/dipeptidyl aminopeptidase/acylaminoacyl peptidase